MSAGTIRANRFHSMEFIFSQTRLQRELFGSFCTAAGARATGKTRLARVICQRVNFFFFFFLIKQRLRIFQTSPRSRYLSETRSISRRSFHSSRASRVSVLVFRSRNDTPVFIRIRKGKRGYEKGSVLRAMFVETSFLRCCVPYTIFLRCLLTQFLATLWISAACCTNDV